MQFVPPQRHAFAWGVITLVLGVVLWVLGPVLMPFVVAAVLAYALNPVVRGLERVGKPWIPSIVAVLLVEIGFLVMVVAVFTLLVPIVVTELPQMRDKLPTLLERGQTFLAPWLASMGVQVSLDPESLKAFVFLYISQKSPEKFSGDLKKVSNAFEKQINARGQCPPPRPCRFGRWAAIPLPIQSPSCELRLHP